MVLGVIGKMPFLDQLFYQVFNIQIVSVENVIQCVLPFRIINSPHARTQGCHFNQDCFYSGTQVIVGHEVE